MSRADAGLAPLSSAQDSRSPRHPQQQRQQQQQCGAPKASLSDAPGDAATPRTSSAETADGVSRKRGRAANQKGPLRGCAPRAFILKGCRMPPQRQPRRPPEQVGIVRCGACRCARAAGNARPLRNGAVLRGHVTVLWILHRGTAARLSWVTCCSRGVIFVGRAELRYCSGQV